MTSRKNWVWIVVACVAAGAGVLTAVAGAGIYFVAPHIQSDRSTSADALTAFDSAAAPFRNQRALYELDSADEPRLTRPLSELPTAGSRPAALQILAWDPDAERLVRVSLPFWVLRLGRAKMSMTGAGQDFDLSRLHLDADELQRIGPALVFDFRGREGARVLLWTQ
jgi:hypothetical protein